MRHSKKFLANEVDLTDYTSIRKAHYVEGPEQPDWVQKGYKPTCMRIGKRFVKRAELNGVYLLDEPAPIFLEWVNGFYGSFTLLFPGTFLHKAQMQYLVITTGPHKGIWEEFETL